MVAEVHARRVGVSGHLADDLRQEAALAALGALRTWSPSGGASPVTWCERRAQGAVRDALRAELPRGTRRSAVRARIVDDGALAGVPAAEDAGLSVEVADLLAALPERERVVLREVYLCGRSQAEAARGLGVSPALVCGIHASALARARELAGGAR